MVPSKGQTAPWQIAPTAFCPARLPICRLDKAAHDRPTGGSRAVSRGYDPGGRDEPRGVTTDVPGLEIPGSVSPVIDVAAASPGPDPAAAVVTERAKTPRERDRGIR